MTWHIFTVVIAAVFGWEHWLTGQKWIKAKSTVAIVFLLTTALIAVITLKEKKHDESL